MSSPEGHTPGNGHKHDHNARERKAKLKERAEDMMEQAYWDGYEDARVSRAERDTIKRFRRDPIDGVWAGVCAGIGNYLGVDAIWVRLVFVGLVLAGAGFPIFVYIGLWIFTKSDDRAPYRREAREVYRAERRASRAARKADNAAQNAAEIAERRARRNAARDTSKLSDVRSKFRSIETRMQDLEKNITSKEWQLRRDFRDLED